MNALVVDDDDIVLRSCQRVLSEAGYAVRLAPNARAALEAIAQETPDLVIADVKMPVRDGIWLAHQILKQYPTLPIIITSGYVVPEVVQQAFDLGAAVFLPKPFTPDELLATVRKALNKEQVP
jgi:DNA-binding NtrC family response regulator